MIAWSRLAIARSGPCISAIFASTSRSPSSLFLLARASAFNSRARSFIAARSSSVNPLDVLPVAVVLLGDFCAVFFAGFLSAIAKHLLRAAHEPLQQRVHAREAGLRSVLDAVLHRRVALLRRSEAHRLRQFRPVA